MSHLLYCREEKILHNFFFIDKNRNSTYFLMIQKKNVINNFY